MVKKFLIKNWQIITIICTIAGAIFSFGRNVEKIAGKIQKIEAISRKNEEKMEKIDSILIIVKQNQTDLSALKSHENMQDEHWKAFLLQNKEVNKELFEQLTNGMNNINEQVKGLTRWPEVKTRIEKLN